MLRSRIHGWAAGILALVLCGAELGSAGHAALVRHAICAEHGEAVHAGAPENERASVVASSDAVVPVEPAVVFVDDHEHCKITAGASRIVSPDRGLPGLVSPDLDAKPAADRIPVAPAVALFRLAPKNSPPVAG